MKRLKNVTRFWGLVLDNYRISTQSIRSNLLRTTLTVLIIAFGIMALVGILTAIDSIERSVSSSFSSMGANTFTIRSRGYNVQIGRNRTRIKNHSRISYLEATRFKEEFSFPASVSVSVGATGNATVKYGSYKSNPNVGVRGVDEAYLQTAGYLIEQGRNFTEFDIRSGSSHVILGAELAKNIFDQGEDPIDKYITIANGRFRVVGILQAKGASLIGSGDRMCWIPVSYVRQYYSNDQTSFEISVFPNEGYKIDDALGEAEGLFRIIRGLDAYDPSDFHLIQSDSIAEMLISSMGKVTMAATLIGIITLLGAAIGLMNIMLVSVTERTREVGIRKAVGANNRTIKQQFLFEAVLIGQLGGVVGIILGILIGNIIPMITGGTFVIPWIWMIMGIVLCFLVGIISGLYPALKAAQVDPIESLRHE